MTPPVRLGWQASRISGLRRFTVLSPHLDDAALSLGGTIARATRAGAEVTVLTVLGGDVEDVRPAVDWDRRCGFATAGEAVRVRRQEEVRACRRLRANGVQLPFADEQYAGSRQEATIWNAIQPALEGTEAVLIPGWPLLQSDHRWLTRTAGEHLPSHLPVGVYVDQPYAVWETAGLLQPSQRMLRWVQQGVRSSAALRGQEPWQVGELAGWEPPQWEVASLGISALAEKTWAIRAYESQLRAFGRLFLTQIMLHAWADGGEPIGWLR